MTEHICKNPRRGCCGSIYKTRSIRDTKAQKRNNRMVGGYEDELALTHAVRRNVLVRQRWLKPQTEMAPDVSVRVVVVMV